MRNLPVVLIHTRHSCDKSVSGSVSVVFVHISSLNMAAPLSNCIVVEEGAVTRFLLSESVKTSEIYRRMLALRFTVQGGSLLHENARPHSAAGTLKPAGS